MYALFLPFFSLSIDYLSLSFSLFLFNIHPRGCKSDLSLHCAFMHSFKSLPIVSPSFPSFTSLSPLSSLSLTIFSFFSFSWLHFRDASLCRLQKSCRFRINDAFRRNPLFCNTQNNSCTQNTRRKLEIGPNHVSL